jgi:23S rRNA (guanosine2251-2'-O)-methyltransferase
MVEKTYQFYECDNPACGLRFPGYNGLPRWNRCPRCRSSIHVVATVNYFPEQANQTGENKLLQVEALLDNVRSALNVGSIFRTAEGTGIHQLYLCGITPSPDNPKVCKTALGAESMVSWKNFNNAVVLAKDLKSIGCHLWALEDVANAQPLFDVTLDRLDSPIVLIVGNELSGIDPGIMELCEKVIAIPMMGKKRSYNAAVAFGIAASFLLYRQSFSHGSRNIFPKT